jgi:hypothetical protein
VSQDNYYHLGAREGSKIMIPKIQKQMLVGTVSEALVTNSINRPLRKLNLASIGIMVSISESQMFNSPKCVQQATLYDYLALLPALITAITPLILGLKGKTSSEQDTKKDST